MNLGWMFIPHISAEFLRRPALARRWLTREGPNHKKSIQPLHPLHDIKRGWAERCF